MKILKAFIKSFGAPQRSVKMKTELNFFIPPKISEPVFLFRGIKIEHWHQMSLV